MLLPKGPGGDEGSQPVEAVEDGAPEDQFLHGRTEEYDDQDYRRYGHARALARTQPTSPSINGCWTVDSVE